MMSWLFKAHVNITVREIAKFHAISFCMNSCPEYQGSGATLQEKYSLLSTDSIYREETYQVSPSSSPSS